MGVLSVVSFDPPQSEATKAFAMQLQIKQFQVALALYKTDVGQYPSTDEGLEALRTNPGSYTNWKGPYLQADIPQDPWGHEYVYSFSLGAPPHVGTIEHASATPENF